MLLDFCEIIYARSDNGTARVSTSQGCFNFAGTLSELTGKLDRESSFFRVHKSYVINLHFVKEVVPWFKGTYWVIMADGENTQIPVSKAQVKTLKQLLGL